MFMIDCKNADNSLQVFPLLRMEMYLLIFKNYMWPCDLLWKIECGRNGVIWVQSLYFKKMCGSCSCSRTQDFHLNKAREINRRGETKWKEASVISFQVSWDLKTQPASTGLAADYRFGVQQRSCPSLKQKNHPA